jgi:serine phosphatase RsbU (regulator of sigma subunit)
VPSSGDRTDFQQDAADAALHERTLTMNVAGFRPEADPASYAHFLVVIEGTERGRRIRLAPALTIGRREPCELVLDDPEASRVHCRVVAEGHDAVVTDLQSTNGTFIDGARITGSAMLPNGGILRVGRHKLRHEYRTTDDVAEAEAADRDLARASHYIRSLLPDPIASGDIRIDWRFEPSARVGGDCFGYHILDEQRIAMYLIDVSGHGTGAALHAVSVMNVLRHQALRRVDMRHPAGVLRHLNEMFQMDDHGGMYFTLWYGVYHAQRNVLGFASAGHHPAYIVTPQRQTSMPLQTRNVPIGAFPDVRFKSDSIPVARGSVLHLFSDGVFEITTQSGEQARLDDMLPLLLEPAQNGLDEPSRIYEAIRGRSRDGIIDDDFSFMTVTFV